MVVDIVVADLDDKELLKDVTSENSDILLCFVKKKDADEHF